MRKVIVFFVALIVLAATGGILYQVRGSPETFITSPIEPGHITSVVKATGTVDPVDSVVVGSYVSGVIAEVYCDYNTVVTRGQLCAKIDPAPYHTVVDQATANLAISRAQLEKDKAGLAYAKLNYERNLRLVQSNAVSQDAVDSAKNAVDQLQAQVSLDDATVNLQQAQLATAQVNLGYTNIVSPVNGVVISRNIARGETVAASFQTPRLFLIANDLLDMRLYGKIDEADIGRVKLGQTVKFTVDAYPDRTYTGKVLGIRRSPEVVQSVVTYTVVISAPNPDQALYPGMTATLRIIVDDTGEILKLSNLALRFRPKDVAKAKASTFTGSADANTATVWVPSENGRAVERQIVVGKSDETDTELVSGNLALGDQVIIGIAKPASRASNMHVGL